MQERLVSHREALEIANRRLRGLTSEDLPGTISSVSFPVEVTGGSDTLAATYEIEAGSKEDPRRVESDLLVAELRSWAADDLQMNGKPIVFWFEAAPEVDYSSPTTEV